MGERPLEQFTLSFPGLGYWIRVVEKARDYHIWRERDYGVREGLWGRCTTQRLGTQLQRYEEAKCICKGNFLKSS